MSLMAALQFPPYAVEYFRGQRQQTRIVHGYACFVQRAMARGNSGAHTLDSTNSCALALQMLPLKPRRSGP